MRSLGVIVFIACFIATPCSSMKYKDCGSLLGAIKKVEVSSCEGDVCKLVKGRNYTISVTFSESQMAKKVKAVVYGIIAGISVPFQIPQSDGCQTEFSGLTCPLEAGSDYKYTATLPVKKIYPSIKLVVKWELQQEEAKDIICFESPLEIVSS